MSGVTTHVERHRAKVIAECVIEEQPIFEYRSRGKNLSGIYEVHTEIIPQKNDSCQVDPPEQLLDKLNNPTTIPEQSQDSATQQPALDHNNTTHQPTSDQVRPKKAENGNDLREEKRREEKDSCSENEKEEAKYKKIIGLLTKACPSWYPSNDLIIDRVTDLITEYPEHQLTAVITRAGENGVKNTAFLGYIEGGLRNFEKYYGKQSGNGSDRLEPKSREESDFQVAASQYKIYCKWAKNGTADPAMAKAALKSCINLCEVYEPELEDKLQTSVKQLRQKLNAIVEEHGG